MPFFLKVFFDNPFWVGLFTISEGTTAQYCRIVFGEEPSDNEIYDFFQRNYRNLKFSELLPAEPEELLAKSPKRRQREINKSLQKHSVENKSYQTIKQSLQQSQKTHQKAARKQQIIKHEAYVMQVKKAKRKENHRGH
jgi:hypothetical protein